ncbi:MAG TPA: M23 family metallopeptidase [Candidatus Paceibacterota bacterium]|nr:M23 family metallopeptidase [Candidatus Paceibacterota bacterium]
MTNPTPTETVSVAAGDIPLTNAKSRETKKPFGIYVTPSDSPVSPEKFTGYHTGLDFETTPAEADIDVPVRALCDGTLLVKEYATGYGGVAVQSCVLDGQPVTVIYGHLKLASITPAVGSAIARGDALGVLGKGYSTETDGERKHLHLGIHKGTTINILGYVQTKAALNGWLDPAPFI